VVEGVNPTDIQDTLEQAAQIVIKVKSAADNIENATRKLDQQVMSEETLTNLRVAISNLSVLSSNTDQLITDARGLVGKANNGIDSTLANLAQASTNLNQFSTNLALASAKTLDIVKANEDDVRSAVQNIKTSSEHLNTMLANVESGQGTIGKLLTDDSFHQELKRLVTNLRRFGILKYRDEPLLAEPPKAELPKPRSKP
jgi:phospholipid/cholesterol/gamma-HCH transport system substrate-binding protein